MNKDRPSNMETSESEVIKTSVIRALAFFDLFDYPLTEIEIWQNMDKVCAFRDLQKILKSEFSQIGQKNGFYFLLGRDKLVEKRLGGYNLYNKKIQIAKKAAHFLSFVPGVEMVAACNNFSYSDDSDIDFFIITNKSRLWTSRLLVTFLIHILGLRRHGSKIKDRICLSFYITKDNYDLSSLLFRKQGKIDDPYFLYWLNDLLPLYGEKTFSKFWQANKWLKNYLPNITKPATSPGVYVSESKIVKILKFFPSLIFRSRIGDYLEELFRKIQIGKMSKNKDSVADSGDTRVVISDTILKFHEQDRRAEYREQWEMKISRI